MEGSQDAGNEWKEHLKGQKPWNPRGRRGNPRRVTCTGGQAGCCGQVVDKGTRQKERSRFEKGSEASIAGIFSTSYLSRNIYSQRAHPMPSYSLCFSINAGTVAPLRDVVLAIISSFLLRFKICDSRHV
jgi:hypothetical protein